MVWTTITVGWITMARQDDLCLQFASPDGGCVEVADFKPQKHAVSRLKAGVANAPVMVFHIPLVQLKDQPLLRDESLIVRAAMIAPAAKKALIPAAARLNVPHAD
jgi:hypothetical protein